MGSFWSMKCYTLKRKNLSGMLVKLDIAKSYDKLNWQFIRKMLEAFGFTQNWVNWIMQLISSAFFSILVNGVPSGIIKPSRGIRQGDPLSPFLFIIMAEGLGRSISVLRDSNSIRGLRGTTGGNRHTHHKFVDDTMLMDIPLCRKMVFLNCIWICLVRHMA